MRVRPAQQTRCSSASHQPRNRRPFRYHSRGRFGRRRGISSALAREVFKRRRTKQKWGCPETAEAQRALPSLLFGAAACLPQEGTASAFLRFSLCPITPEANLSSQE